VKGVEVVWKWCGSVVEVLLKCHGIVIEGARRETL